MFKRPALNIQLPTREPRTYTKHEYRLRMERIAVNAGVVLLFLLLLIVWKYSDTQRQEQANYNDSVVACVDSGQSPLECKASLTGGN